MGWKGKLPRGISMAPNGLYRARLTYHGQRYQVGAYFTRGDAEAALAIARSQVAREAFVPVPQRHRQWREEQEQEAAQALTVATWSAQWLEQLEKAGRSPSTLTSYRSTLRAHVLPVIGPMRLSDVKPSHVDSLMAGATTAVQFNIVRCLSSMFRAAIAGHVGGLSESPVSQSTGSFQHRLRRPEGSDDATPAEIMAIADKLPQQLALVPPLATLCALRMGEILGLERKDFQLDNDHDNWLHIERQWLSKQKPHPGYAPPKVGSTGIVAIPEMLVPDIVAHLRKFVADAPESPVFPSSSDKRRPISQSALDRAWRLAKADIRPDLHAHSMRHIGLTRFNQAGATPAETLKRGRQGGHDASIYGRYQNASRKRDQEITELMGKRWEAELS